MLFYSKEVVGWQAEIRDSDHVHLVIPDEMEDWDLAPLWPTLRPVHGEFEEVIVRLERKAPKVERHTRGGLNANSERDATPQARAARQSLRGGAKQNLTTIAMDGCWCGEKHGHDWPGKSSGEPHPRFSTAKEEVEKMTMTATEGISKNHIKAYHRDVQTLLMDLINNHGVKHRIIDGGHILLYSGKETADLRPFKVAAARRPENQLRYLTKWALEYIPSYADAAINAVSREKEKETPVPVAPEIVRVAAKEAEQAPEPEPDDGWKPYVDSEGKTSDIYQTDGSTYRCKACLGTDHEYTTTDARGFGGHKRVYHSDSPTMWSEEARAKATATRQKNSKKKKVAEAIALISELAGIEPPPTDLQERITELTEELAVANKRADDAEAKLARLREALSA